MDDQEFRAIQATFPWTQRIIHTRSGGLIQILDNKGQEVSLISMADFLTMITRRLMPKQAEGETTQEEK